MGGGQSKERCGKKREGKRVGEREMGERRGRRERSKDSLSEAV